MVGELNRSHCVVFVRVYVNFSHGHGDCISHSKAIIQQGYSDVQPRGVIFYEV